MLDVSSIVTGRLQLQRRPVDIVDVARQAADAANHVALSKGLRVESSLPAHPVAVDGDPARLQQIVSNLLSNAIKFTDSGGEISMRVECQANTAVVTVQDTGIGIAPEFLPRIFDAFVQADQTSTRAAGGLGLGLAIVRYLAEAHDGSVTAASDGPGRGATFVVRLPAAP
jgi:signal transduction histidine kinase